MKKYALIFTLIASINSFSQELNLDNLKTFSLNNNIRLNHIFINQPDITYCYNPPECTSTYTLKPKMGLLGFNYNISLNDWLYTGAGFHGASIGDQGGLFTLGVNLGVKLPIYKNLFFDANIHFGGGGGFRSLVNGGAIVYPSAGLKYSTKHFAFGAQYGMVDFTNGIQGGDNFSFFVEIPTSIKAASYANSNKKYEVIETDDVFWDKPASKTVQLIKFDFFFPRGETRNDGLGNFNNTTPITQTLQLIGFEYQRYVDRNTFLYAHVDTMYKGLRSGFMDVFVGIGNNFIETEYVNLYAKMGIGAAGGRIFPENGLTMYPSAGLDIKFSEHFGLSLHGGYHRSIGATFEALTAGVGFKYLGLNGGHTDPNSGEKAKYIKTQGISIGVQNQTYFKVAILDRAKDPDLQQIALKINYDINRRFYVAAETSFAYDGGAGGYAHGIFGLGVKSNRFAQGYFSLFAEAAAGVAGGGGVDSGEGLLLRPTAGINYHVNDNLNFNISGGQIKSVFGNVNSTNINVGLTYSLSILNLKK